MLCDEADRFGLLGLVAACDQAHHPDEGVLLGQDTIFPRNGARVPEAG